MFEQIGEHAQAAALRLEHAHTLDDLDQRLASLREGAARNLGDTAQGRELHRALARALLSSLEMLPDGVRRRALFFEAAQALGQADEHHEAGMVYERLGLLRRAAAAYEAAGSLGPLEVVLSVLERQADAARARRETVAEIDAALREGRRSLAADLLAELAPAPGAAALVSRESDAAGGAGLDAASFARRLAQLEAARPPSHRLRLLVTARGDRMATAERDRTHTLVVHGLPTFGIGRAPDADLTLAAATLSRDHARLSVLPIEALDDAPGLVVEDLGSKIGTFWDGIPVDPGKPEPITAPGELALGMAASVRVFPVGGDDPPTSAVVTADDGVSHQFAPKGGTLELRGTEAIEDHEDIRVGLCDVAFGARFSELAAAPGVRVTLGLEPLGPGARVELLVGDRLELSAPGVSVTLEVQA